MQAREGLPRDPSMRTVSMTCPTASLRRLAFTKADRIRTASDFRNLSRQGKRHFSDYFIIVFRKNQFSRSRLGITVSKKVGKAVTRNRIKRIIREFFRSNKTVLPVGADINVIARKPAGTIGNVALRNHLCNDFKVLAQKTKKP